MSENVKVSLIIPVCNVEKYLPEALDSAVGQTLRDIEIICVDDGSADSSGEILDTYAADDSRIRVLHKINEGYGKTMNIGLEMAKGKYVAILEPDDYLDIHMMKDLLAIAEGHQLDFVKSDFAFFEGEQGNYHNRMTHIYWKENMYGKVLSKVEQKELFRGYMAYWTCLYRRDFIEQNNIRFNETAGASYQDTGFWFQTMVLAKRIYLHRGCYYHYRQDNPGASTKSTNKVYNITVEYDFIRDQLEKRGMVQEYWPQYIAMHFIGQRDTLYRIDDEYMYDFIMHVAKIFNNYAETGRLDESFMDKQDRVMLRDIIRNPKEFYRKFTQIPMYIHDCLKKYESFYIYGAGTRGLKIYRFLTEDDKNRFKGFVVTARGGLESVDGYCVYDIDNMNSDSKTAFVIGVTERYESEIRQILEGHGISNMVSLSEEMVP